MASGILAGIAIANVIGSILAGIDSITDATVAAISAGISACATLGFILLGITVLLYHLPLAALGTLWEFLVALIY